jgi:hypothetical protein
VGRTDDELVDGREHRVVEFDSPRSRHVDPFDGEADLAGATECRCGYPSRRAFEIGIVEHDRGVVAAEFETA